MLDALIRNPNRRCHPLEFCVAEAVFLDDALDEFLDGKGAEEDGPVVDFGFGSADVDAQGCLLWVSESVRVLKEMVSALDGVGKV